MGINEALIAELKHETSLTKKILEKVPMDKKDWKPHAKSMSLGRLATHITETLKWISTIRHIDDFDFMKDFNFEQQQATSQEELLQLFHTYLDKAINDLSAMSDEEFNKIWTVRRGEQVMFQIPKKVAVRGWDSVTISTTGGNYPFFFVYLMCQYQVCMAPVLMKECKKYFNERRTQKI